VQTDHVKDESWLKVVISLVPAITCELLKGIGDGKPSEKPRRNKRTLFAWLDPSPGPGAGHNPS